MYVLLGFFLLFNSLAVNQDVWSAGVAKTPVIALALSTIVYLGIVFLIEMALISPWTCFKSKPKRSEVCEYHIVCTFF